MKPAAACYWIWDTRLAVYNLTIGVREYLAAPCTPRLREIHVSGVPLFAEHWARQALRASIDAAPIRRFSRCLVEHLPIPKPDWELAAWAMEQVQSGEWGRPWVVTLEYGGAGLFFASVTEADIRQTTLRGCVRW